MCLRLYKMAVIDGVPGAAMLKQNDKTRYCSGFCRFQKPYVYLLVQKINYWVGDFRSLSSLFLAGHNANAIFAADLDRLRC